MERKQQIQKSIIYSIKNKRDIEENYQILRNFLEDQKNLENRSEIDSFLQLIIKISNNHHRYSNFISKIEQILINIKNKLQKFYTKDELFNIFQSNKRLLLFLLQEELIQIDQHVLNTMMKDKFNKSFYLSYFSPEIQLFKEKNFSSNDQLPENFQLNRQIGENEQYICKLIREDLIEDFIIYVNKNDTDLSMKIKPSIFETNSFLLQKETSLIEYSAFFGSVQIFKYLYLNQPDLNTASIWLYAIHSDNPELIHYLDDQKIKPKNESFEECLIEAIKCHHIDVANYILYNFVNLEKYNEKMAFSKAIKYYNFCCFQTDLTNCDDKILFDLCKYNHFEIVEFLLRTKKIENINEKIVLN